jgi:4-hydroxybenzoate polyprenyltransferase
MIKTSNAAIMLLRPMQWSKNLLVFVPVIASHSYASIDRMQQSLGAFLILCLVSSAGYVTNDLIDAKYDRSHPQKKLRPIASGAVPPSIAIAIALTLAVSALGLSLLLEARFSALVVGYLVAVVLYSLVLKSIEIVDTLVLCSFYTFRIYAGAFATGIVVSHWLLVFSTFLFFSLSLMKRHSEVKTKIAVSLTANPTRSKTPYSADDLPTLATIGIGAMMSAILVFCLYLSSPLVVEIYQHSEWLWIVPVILFWILGRSWIRLGRGHSFDDPVKVLIQDYQNWVAAACILAVFYLSK